MATFILILSTTACTPSLNKNDAETLLISQPTFAVAMSNSLTSIVAQQRLSPLTASRIYGYMYAAAFEAYNESIEGEEVINAVSAAVTVGELFFLYQKNPTLEMDALLRRYSPNGHTKFGKKIGRLYTEKAKKDGYLESASSPNPVVDNDLWSYEPTGIHRVPFLDSGYGEVLPLVTLSKKCELEEPNKEIMESEVREMFTSFTPEQTAEPEVLVFLSGIGTPTPPGLMLQIAASHASDANLDEKSALNLLALVAISDNDAGIAAWREKRKFMIARPETVYRRLTGETINLPRDTPPHPSYPSGHSTFAGAATSVMDKVIGIDIPLRMNVAEDQAAPSEEWVFNNTSELRGLVNWSRVRAGFHIKTDVIAGERLGRCVGNTVYDHFKEKGWLKLK